MKAFLVAAVAVCALAVPALAGATSSSSSSVRCVYKMAQLPVYMQLRGLPSAAMCDIVGGNAGGSAVKVYGNPVGSPRCAFALELGVTNTVYSTNAAYGRAFCSSLAKGVSGAKRIF